VQLDSSRSNGGVPAPALTDQAIVKIKDLILTGEFQAGAKLPREQVLAQQLGLSRNSLREAVRALALVGVLDTRVGDGTYVTSLDADLLMTGMGFVGDLLNGKTVLEAHQVRRILEPVATGLAASRLTQADLAELLEALERMERADKTQAFIDADNDFHRIINSAANNATLASLIQNLSGGMMRARLWRTATEREAVESTKRRHRDIYDALVDGDAERASAADLIHLAEGERWLELMLASGELSGPHLARDARLRGTGSGTGMS
jgi:GntR family transcriptional regulator, transcriptional repressor for pyruvate dehydrogenase complex